MSLTPIVQDPVQADIDTAKTALLAGDFLACVTDYDVHYADIVTSKNLVVGFKNDAKTAMDTAAAKAALAHAAQIAKNVGAAESQKNLAETAKDEAKTASDSCTAEFVNARNSWAYAAAQSGVSGLNVDATSANFLKMIIPSGPSYLNPEGLLVPSTSGSMSGLAADKYLAAKTALDTYNMKLANYNNALAVPASDANKKSQADLDAMLADVNTAADSYNAAQLVAKGSSQLAAEYAALVADVPTTNYETAKLASENAASYAASAAAYYAAAQYDATNAASKPITVNLNIEIDAENNISVFGEKPIQPENVIVAQYKLPVDGLYDNANTKGLIEFWEPVDAQGDIRVELAHTALCGGADSYKDTSVKLVNEIERVLCDEFDCSGCKPFNDAKYDGVASYTTQRDFGRVALGTLAHFLFGHVDATSAITNDVAFIQNMLSLTLGTDSQKELAAINETITGPAARFARYDPMVVEGVSDLVEELGSAADAKLAKRLVGAILRKGLGADVSGGRAFKSSNVIANADDSNCLANIVRQVIGQDQTRSMNQDNSERTVDEHILLRFYPDDIIFMNIKLKKPTVTLSPGPNATTSLTPGSLSDSYANEISFTLKVTLSAPGK